MIKPERFLFLDGLRAVAALMVMCHHFYSLVRPAMEPSYLDVLFNSGKLGVPIFFVLSGFVIAYSIRNLQLSFFAASCFILRRSLRLDPPFWAALSLSLIISFLIAMFMKHAHGVDFLSVLANASYLQDFLGYERSLAVSWTLCLELQFYLFFILLMTLLKNVSQHSRIGAFLALYVISLIQSRFLIGFLNIPGLFLPFWYSFSIGCMAAWLFLKQINERIFLIALLLMLPLLKDPLVLGAIMTALSILFAIKSQALSTWLSSTFFQYLGKRSYSIYLIHWVIGVKFIDIATRRLSFDPISLFIIATVLTLLCSELFYRLAEKPFLLLSKSIHLENKDALEPSWHQFN